MGDKSTPRLLWLLWASALARSAGAILFWTAYVEVSYSDRLDNHTSDRRCECGIYGRSSPLEATWGLAVLPVSDPVGCVTVGNGGVVYNPNASLPWIALVKRGNCSFGEKINAAKRQGAAGVLVYNLDGTGNGTSSMAHYDARDLVAVMIGNLLGAELAALVGSGVPVTVTIEVGTPHGPWMDSYWLYFLSIAFFVVTAASISYFLFVSAHRLHAVRTFRRAERRLKSQAQKAIGRLEVRRLKPGDVETASDVHSCAVCIDAYRPRDAVTVLTCGHFFHKACIEPWLLDKRTCPMCKSDILKALGVEPEGGGGEEEEREVGSSPPAPEVAVATVSGGEAMYDVPLTDPPTDDAEKQPGQERQHHYDNRGFEGDCLARGYVAVKA